MNDFVTRQETHEAYHGWEIAVDLRYRDVVLANLKELDSEADPPSAEAGDAEPRLDLGIVTLPAVDRTAGKIRVKYGALPERDYPIDTVLEGLRHHISVKHGGWEIRMGKNRNTDTVGGLPHIGTGGWYYPTAEGQVSVFELEPETSPEGQGVRVGVIDSVMFANPQLANRWYALEASSHLSGPEPFSWLNGHSAFVAGQILRRAPAAKLEIRGVLDGPDSTATVWEVARAMASFLSTGVGVLNMSVGCYTADGKAPFVLERAVDVLSRAGVVLVASAGNHGESGASDIVRNAPIFPAACAGAVAVGALWADESNHFYRAPFSPDAQWVNLVAPGLNVHSAYLKGKVQIFRLPGLTPPPAGLVDFPGAATWSGTSFSAAAVSGEIARLAVPGKTPMQVLDGLLAREPNQQNGAIGRYHQGMPVKP